MTSTTRPEHHLVPAHRGRTPERLHPLPGVEFLGMPVFPDAAKIALRDRQLRENLAHATGTIRAKRKKAVGELDDWQQLRTSAAAIKDRTLAHLDEYLTQFEAKATEAGARVHWAVDAEDACRIAVGIAESHNASDVIKVKSMATQEIGLNEALEAQGIHAWETDLAELIVQLGGDTPSHFLVPAIHRNRSEIKDIFARRMAEVGRPAPDDLTDDPARLAEAARLHLREKFLTTRVAFSGANFAIAESGTLVVVESEGNGRMCLTLPDVLVSVVGIEKLLPTFDDLEVFMQVLPRSATAERMNPYTSMWTGVTPGDGPQETHIILLDNGRTRALADKVGRQALRCIRCSACLNVCPVYERVGGHAYGSVYPGPIGAILNPLLHGVTEPHDAALPFASSLCGACFEACPVAIDIPSVLIDQRAKAVAEKAEHGAAPGPEELSMRLAGWTFGGPKRLGVAQRVAGALGGVIEKIPWLPGLPGGWTRYRRIPRPAKVSFRRWWREDAGRASGALAERRSRPASGFDTASPSGSPGSTSEPPPDAGRASGALAERRSRPASGFDTASPSEAPPDAGRASGALAERRSRPHPHTTSGFDTASPSGSPGSTSEPPSNAGRASGALAERRSRPASGFDTASPSEAPPNAGRASEAPAERRSRPASGFDTASPSGSSGSTSGVSPGSTSGVGNDSTGVDDGREGEGA